MQQQDQVWGNDEHWLGEEQAQDLLRPMLAAYSPR
jgi:hypothetical protein